MAFETLGELGPSSVSFRNDVENRLIAAANDRRTGKFQRLLVNAQGAYHGNGAGVPRPISGSLF